MKKIQNAQTGGRATAEEQRRLGANPDACTVYETYVYHLMPRDEDLREAREWCTTGTKLCGACKDVAKERVAAFLREHQEKKAATAHLVKDVVRDD